MSQSLLIEPILLHSQALNHIKNQKKLLLHQKLLKISKITFAFGESVKSFSTLLAQTASKINFAWTFTIDRLTIVAISAIKIAIAFSAIWIAEVAVRAGIAIWWLEFFATFTNTGFFSAVSSRVGIITVAG